MTDDSNLGVALVKELCPACTTEMDGPIMMNKILTRHSAKKVKDLHGQVIGFADHFCEQCEGHSKLGVILVTVDESKSENMANPFRTGGIFVVKEEYIERTFGHDKELLAGILKKRMTYIEHDAAVQMGLFDQDSKQDGNNS